jgi:ATP/maltotriose-dependent transcriptional regulator MalT
VWRDPAERGPEPGQVGERRLLQHDPALTRVLILTTFDLDEYVYQALLAPSITRKVIQEFARRPGKSLRPATGLGDLTAREHEVLTLLARGLSNSPIAEALVISDATVKTHVARVLMKLNLADRVQAVILAYETGLVQPGEA